MSRYTCGVMSILAGAGMAVRSVSGPGVMLLLGSSAMMVLGVIAIREARLQASLDAESDQSDVLADAVMRTRSTETTALFAASPLLVASASPDGALEQDGVQAGAIFEPCLAKAHEVDEQRRIGDRAFSS